MAYVCIIALMLGQACSTGNRNARRGKTENLASNPATRPSRADV